MWLLLALLLWCVSGNFVSNALGSHMVLQRSPQKAHLWGWSKQSGSTVTVQFGSNTLTTTSQDSGRWSLFLPPTPASGPYTINVTSSVGESSVLEDIMFGDVFLCSGQSNMAWGVATSWDPEPEIQKAKDYPNVRIFQAGWTGSQTPENEFASIAITWSRAAPENVPSFSAVCWYFGQALHDHLKIPIGLVVSSVGGTEIQLWSSPEILSECDRKQLPPSPSIHWNGMIVPLLPMTVRDMLWYQGETNAVKYDPKYYACAFPVMVKDWRQKWQGDNRPDVGFFFVQLAPWKEDNELIALTRMAQLWALTLPNTGLATAIDLGDPESPHYDVHPRYKKEISLRLAATARALSYKEDVSFLGPMATSFLPGNDTNSVYVTFNKESIGSGLKQVEFSCPPTVDKSMCSEYELKLSNSGWVTATATIVGPLLKLTSTVDVAQSNSKITAVRYAYSAYPIATLRNNEGFPGLPFYLPHPLYLPYCDRDSDGNCPEAAPTNTTTPTTRGVIFILSLVFLGVVITALAVWIYKKRKKAQLAHEVFLDMPPPSSSASSSSTTSSSSSSSSVSLSSSDEF